MKQDTGTKRGWWQWVKDWFLLPSGSRGPEGKGGEPYAHALAKEMFEDWKKNHAPEFMREQLDAMAVEFVRDFRLIDPIWAERTKYKAALEAISAVAFGYENPYAACANIHKIATGVLADVGPKTKPPPTPKPAPGSQRG